MFPRRLTLAGGLALAAAVTLLGPAATAQPSKADGIAAFETVKQVLQHPRCQNCHIPGDAPLQFDQGVAHQMGVVRGPDGQGVPGLACSTCHATQNPPESFGAHTPPGAPSWELPPPKQKMVFINLSSAALCKQLKDTKRNGGKSLEALLEHVSHDKLVLWGWSPGVGRAPVSVPHDELVAAFKTWVEAGAPCAPGK
jgi:hypothetical protein